MLKTNHPKNKPTCPIQSNTAHRRPICAAVAVIFLLTLAAPILVSCGLAAKPDKLIIAVSIVPEETFVRAVCGELVEIVTIIPPGSSPESYEASPVTMARLEDAAVYFTIGVPAEESGILPRIAGDPKIVALAEYAAAGYGDLTFESGGERDPHIWLSPKRVKVMIDIIAEEMCDLDPENAAIYEKNAADYTAALDELDTEIRTILAGVQNRKFVAYHPAFGYFADDYGLIMLSLEEEGKEATAKQMAAMIDLAKSEGIKAIFYQEEIDKSQAAAFAEELGGETIQLSPLSADYINNLRKMAELIARVME